MYMQAQKLDEALSKYFGHPEQITEEDNREYINIDRHTIMSMCDSASWTLALYPRLTI
jgi:hypothetical protein